MAFLLLHAISAGTVTATVNATIYIIRHGEKTFGGGCLNIQGQERANHIPSVFNGSAFARPKVLFANKYYDAATDPRKANCERCFLTVQPIAQFLQLDLIFDFGYPAALGGNAGAAKAIKASALEHGVVLVAWEHYNIQFLTAALGVPKAQIPEWSGDDYDSIYELEVSPSGAISGFEVKAQRFTPQSTTCPPHYVPPASAPPSPPTPVPAGKRWECHAKHTTTNAMGLADADLNYVGSNLSDCENECNARACSVVVWHVSDEHCHVLAGSVSQDDYLRSLTASSDRTTCMLVPQEA